MSNETWYKEAHAIRAQIKVDVPGLDQHFKIPTSEVEIVVVPLQEAQEEIDRLRWIIRQQNDTIQNLKNGMYQ